MTSKKIAPERRPFCDPRLADAKFRRHRMLHLKDPAVEIVKKGGKRPINDCPFYNMQYGFDELPLDPIKDFLQEKICKYFVADSKKGAGNSVLRISDYTCRK